MLELAAEDTVALTVVLFGSVIITLDDSIVVSVFFIVDKLLVKASTDAFLFVGEVIMAISVEFQLVAVSEALVAFCAVLLAGRKVV